MPVNSKKKEFNRYAKQWQYIDDCIVGTDAVKAKGTTYLPMPSPDDSSKENLARYQTYLERAIFYNVTSRTLSGLVGQIFARDPVVKLPPLLELVDHDATGSGVPLYQLAKATSELTVAHGRCGLFADFPERPNGTTVAQLQSGEVRPKITLYHPADIINWRTINVNGNVLLSLVVLKESYVKSDDGFVETTGTQYRVLRLVPDGSGYIYVMEIYIDTGLNNKPSRSTTPLDADGKPFNRLPFTFVGAKTNDSGLDEPPLYSLAVLNIGHYRNSADYEESCFVTGQPTLVASGLTQQWVDDVLNNKVNLGARSVLCLPPNADAKLLQVSPNVLPFEAMKHKEKQMVALGAKLIEDISVQRTATETNLDYAGEVSILSASADNVSDALLFILRCCARFVGEPEDSIQFELNTEFDLVKLSYQDRQQLMAEWQGNAISFTEMRTNLRRAGIATEDDADAKADIDKEKEAEQSAAIALAKATTPANPGTAPASK